MVRDFVPVVLPLGLLVRTLRPFARHFMSVVRVPEYLRGFIPRLSPLIRSSLGLVFSVVYAVADRVFPPISDCF